jgi:N-acetylglutamate synthase-like GNAT family acetyltransferase
MNCKEVNISPAIESDLTDILTLLTSVDLPHEGVKDFLSGFLVAKDKEGRLVGTIGLERHGTVGLLRSAAVAGDLQHTGLGSCLTAAVLEGAEREELEKLVLLTTTAADFFASRFGLSETPRTRYDAEIPLELIPEITLRRSALFRRLHYWASC